MKLSTLFGEVENLNTSSLITVADQTLLTLLKLHTEETLGNISLDSEEAVRSKTPLEHVPHFLNFKRVVRLTGHQDGRLKRGIAAEAVYAPMKLKDVHGVIYHVINDVLYTHVLLTDFTTLTWKDALPANILLESSVKNKEPWVKTRITDFLRRNGFKKIPVEKLEEVTQIPPSVLKPVKSKPLPKLIPDVPGSVEGQLRHELTMKVRDLEKKVEKMEEQLTKTNETMTKASGLISVLVKQLETLL